MEVVYQIDDIHRKKEIRILSCEQICGKHLRFSENPEDIILEFENLEKENPNICHVKTGKNIFTVKGPNSNDITTTSSGKSPWYLVRAIKSSRKQINLLLLNHVIWGVEISSGLQMKKSGETLGKEKVAQFLINRMNSIISDPKNWEEIQFYHR